MMTASKTKWSYAAAGVDMEGCFGLSRTVLKTSIGNLYYGYDLKVSVANVSTDLMKWLVRNFGGEYRPKQKGPLGKKQCYEWFVSGGYKRLELFILGVLPYLVIKRAQALIALEFIRLNGKPNPQKRAELHAKMLSLNSGKAPTTNTLRSPESGLKIESELHGDMQSAPVVTQAA